MAHQRHVRNALAWLLITAVLPACVSGGGSDSPAGDEPGGGVDAEALAWWKRNNHHPHKIEPADFGTIRTPDPANSPPDPGSPPVVVDFSAPPPARGPTMAPPPPHYPSPPAVVCRPAMQAAPPPDLSAPRDLTVPRDLTT